MPDKSIREQIIPLLMYFGQKFDPIGKPGDVNTLTDKTIDQILSTIHKAILEDVIGEDDAPFNMPVGEPVSTYSNALRSEQRKSLSVLLGDKHDT